MLTKVKHKNGIPYMVWEKLSGVRNEPLDISGYALAAAYLVGINRIDWEGEDTDGERVRHREMSVEEEKLSETTTEFETPSTSKDTEYVSSDKSKAKNARRRKRNNNLVDRY